MGSFRRNLGFFGALSLALAIGGTASVAAQDAGSGSAPRAGDGSAADEVTQMRHRDSRGGPRRGFRDRGGRGGFRDRAGMRQPLRLGMAGGVIRTETIVDAGEDGFVTHRMERGEVAAVGDTAISISLANGETSDITITDDTRVLGVARSPIGRRHRVGIVGRSVADISVGDSAMVTSRSVDGGDFEALRILAVGTAEPAAEDGATSDGAEAGAEAGTTSVQSA